MKKHVIIYLSIVFIGISPSFAISCKGLLRAALEKIVPDSPIEITKGADKNQILVKAYDQHFTINNFSRLQTSQIYLAEYLETLTKDEFQKQMYLLKRLTVSKPSVATRTSSAKLIFSQTFYKRVDNLFKSDQKTIQEKLINYFNLYWNERVKLLTSRQQDLVKNIFDDLEGLNKTVCINSKTCYNPFDHKIILSDNYYNLYSELLFKIHEAEHAITYVQNSSYFKISEYIKTSDHGLETIDQLHTLQNEGNSIGAQWEFTQLIPSNIRSKLMEQLEDNSRDLLLSSNPKFATKLLALIEKAFNASKLPEEFVTDFIQTKTKNYYFLLNKAQIVQDLPDFSKLSFNELQQLRSQNIESPESAFLISYIQKNLTQKEASLLIPFFKKEDTQLSSVIIQELNDLKIKPKTDYTLKAKKSKKENSPKEKIFNSISIASLKNATGTKRDFIKKLREIQNYSFRYEDDQYLFLIDDPLVE